MFLDRNIHLEKVPNSIMDSPTLARVERAMLRQEGKSVFYCQASTLPSHAIQKGLLWQQRDKIFSRWKERYFILTRDYLHCFRKASDNGLDKISDMGPFIFKIKLVDVERVTWINKKSYSAIVLDFVRDGRILLRAQKGLEEWFDSLEECTIASKERRKALKFSRDGYQNKKESNANSIINYADNLQREYISDSVPDISKLDSIILRKCINSERKSVEDRCCSGNFSVTDQRLSLLTDIDFSTVGTAQSTMSQEVRATPTACRLNNEVFFLPGLSGVRQRSSVSGGEIHANTGTHHGECVKSRLETDGLNFKSRNLLGSFRVPNMFQTTRGTANRYSLVDDKNSFKVIYSTYEKKQDLS